MKNILTIMSKEFSRFFTDRRMVLMTILPAILIYVVYTFMGSMLQSAFTADEDHKSVIYAVNVPSSIFYAAQSAEITLIPADNNEVESIKEKIVNKEADLIMIFPLQFDALVEAYDVQTATAPAPNIEMYFLSTEPNSAMAYHIMTSILDDYEASLSNKFDINRGVMDSDLATAEDVAANMISTLMPMLLMIFLYSGCMGLALESITGEKERGTLATLLVSPLKRSELALGKILSLGVLAFLIGLVSSLSTILSLPKLMGDTESINVNIYSSKDCLLLGLVILSTLLLLVSIISIVSAFAKSVKEASTSIMPLMLVVMAVGVTGMFGDVASSSLLYMIPIYNSVQCMSGIFSLEYSSMNIVITAVSNLVYAFVGSFVLTKMFSSERIVFSK